MKRSSRTHCRPTFSLHSLASQPSTNRRRVDGELNKAAQLQHETRRIGRVADEMFKPMLLLARNLAVCVQHVRKLLKTRKLPIEERESRRAVCAHLDRRRDVARCERILKTRRDVGEVDGKIGDKICIAKRVCDRVDERAHERRVGADENVALEH